MELFTYEANLLEVLTETFKIVDQYVEIRSALGNLKDAMCIENTYRQFYVNSMMYNAHNYEPWSPELFGNDEFIRHNYNNVVVLSLQLESTLDQFKAEAMNQGVDYDNCQKPEVLEQIAQNKNRYFEMHLKEINTHQAIENLREMENQIIQAKQQSVVLSEQALHIARDPAIWSNNKEVYEAALKRIHEAVELSLKAKEQIAMYEGRAVEQRSIVNTASAELWGRQRWW